MSPGASPAEAAGDTYCPPQSPASLAAVRRGPIPGQFGGDLYPAAAGSGNFPNGARWEVTPEHAAQWLAHRFAGLRGDSSFLRTLGDLAGHDLALLLWDLDLYEGLERRGHNLPPIDQYLRPGREHWGSIAGLLRRLAGADAESQA